MPVGKKRRATKNIGKGDAFYGLEPIIVGVPSNVDVMKALSWYNYTQESEKGHRWLIDWMTKDGQSKSSIQCVKRLNPKRTIPTTFWMAKMLLNGTKFDKETKKRFDLSVKEMINLGNKLRDPDEVVKKEKPNIQERIREKGYNLIADLEDILDDVYTRKPVSERSWAEFSMYDFLQKNEVASQIANQIRDYYKPKLEELSIRDPEVKAAYGSDRLRLKKLFEEWMADLDRYGSNRKATKVKKPRKKKEKLAVDVIKRIKYQKEFKPLKIVSIQPTEIVGAQQLWVYNTKYKQLAVYYAAGAGLSMKGTTLQGFDSDTSEYKTLKKPEEQIARLLGAGKIVLRKFMDEIKTKPRKPNGRINENVVLLRALK